MWGEGLKNGCLHLWVAGALHYQDGLSHRHRRNLNEKPRPPRSHPASYLMMQQIIPLTYSRACTLWSWVEWAAVAPPPAAAVSRTDPPHVFTCSCGDNTAKSQLGVHEFEGGTCESLKSYHFWSLFTQPECRSFVLLIQEVVQNLQWVMKIDMNPSDSIENV